MGISFGEQPFCRHLAQSEHRPTSPAPPTNQAWFCNTDMSFHHSNLTQVSESRRGFLHMRKIPCSEHLQSWVPFVCMGCRDGLQKGASSMRTPSLHPPCVHITPTRGAGTQKRSRGHADRNMSITSCDESCGDISFTQTPGSCSIRP